MTRRMTTILILTAAIAFSQNACFEPAEETNAGRFVFIFLDLSASITDQQRALWLEAWEKIIASLTYGDSVYIHGIHDHTDAVAPIYAGHIPMLSSDPVNAEQAHANKVLNDCKEKALAALRVAGQSPARSQDTDIFSALDLVSRLARGRSASVYIFSDMLQTQDGLNLEKTPLTEDNLQKAIETSVAKRHWSDVTLRGASISVILPSAQIGQSGRECNSIRVVRSFYVALFQELGGVCQSFETHLGQVQEGENL